MPRFDSPIGSKKFEGQALREFDVPDEGSSHAPPPNQQNRRRNLEETANLDLGAIRDFQSRMQSGGQTMGNSSAPPANQRFNGMGGHATDDVNRGEREIREMKEVQQGRGRLSEGARRRIDILLGMVRETRNVDLSSGVYILQTLRSQEMREALVAFADFDGTVQGPFEIRRQLLARAIIQVAGAEIEQFIGSSSLDGKLALIDDLPEQLLNRLFAEYELMVQETRDKYAIKNEQDAKEVLEDLKK